MTIEQVKDIILNSDEISKDSPEPLRRALEQPTEFPLDALPPILKETVLAINDIVQAPIPLCVQSVLSAVNLAVQGHINIKNHVGEVKPTSCYFLTIAESGERKTSCDEMVLKEFRAYEENLRKQYNIDLFKYNNKQEAWESERNRIRKDYQKHKNKSKLEADLNELGSSPKPPLTPLLTCPDPTFEGLCALMTESRPSIGIFSSEGGQFISGYSMKSENKIATATAFSGLWNEGEIRRVRKGDGVTILPGKRLCMHLMVQPNIGINFLSDFDLKSQGLFSRFLISKPESTMGTRLHQERKDKSNKALDQFSYCLKEILEKKLPTKLISNNELQPKIVEMDDDALKLCIEFSDDIEKKLARGKELESIRGFAGKLVEHACRIAATLAAFDNIDLDKLEYQYMEMGVKIANYYCSEALRLLNHEVINPNIELAEKLIDWLQNKWDGGEYISLPDIYQNSFKAISTRSKALGIINILEKHGHLKREKEPILIKGKKRQEVFKIIKG